jgi:hypothetical protein
MNCENIRNLLYYYIYDELNLSLQEYVSMHLEECDSCNEFYKEMRKFVNNNKNLENISAYIDSELSDKENIALKKNIISNNKVRQELENMTNISNLIKNSLSKQEYLLKEDYSKNIFKMLNISDEINKKNVYPKIFGIILTLFIGLCIFIIIAV